MGFRTILRQGCLEKTEFSFATYSTCGLVQFLDAPEERHFQQLLVWATVA